MSSHEPTKMYFFLDILIEIIITCISMVILQKISGRFQTASVGHSGEFLIF